MFGATWEITFIAPCGPLYFDPANCSRSWVFIDAQVLYI